MIRRGAIILLIMVLTGSLELAPAQAPDEQGFEIVKNLDIYSNVIKELNTNYVDDIKPGELTKTAIDAMLESLDPYTNFITENEIEDYKFITTGEYGGIGALIHQNGDYVVISEPYEGSPAQKSDLRAGDIILEINGQSAKGKSYSDVSAILKGQSGTSITLKIQRPGEDIASRENPQPERSSRSTIFLIPACSGMTSAILNSPVLPRKQHWKSNRPS